MLVVTKLFYIRLKQRAAFLPSLTPTLTHNNTQLKPTQAYTHTPTHTQSQLKIPTKSQRFFDSIFSIFDSFPFLNCLMIFVLQKTP